MASNLTSLDLAMYWRYFDFAKLSVPKLKRLVLRDGGPGIGILGFLERHNTTLEVLQLVSVFFATDETSLLTLFEPAKTKSLLTLKSMELKYMLESRPVLGAIPYNEWPMKYPDMVAPGRAIRFLMCQEKTDMNGEHDAVSGHPYDWDSITWTTIESDIRRFSRDRELSS
ncbi:hypothetical protein MMC10_006489 [Thelotrema lepadinum]|nr:hypothetical protein [Thelotrema lepadinum]